MKSRRTLLHTLLQDASVFPLDFDWCIRQWAKNLLVDQPRKPKSHLALGSGRWTRLQRGMASSWERLLARENYQIQETCFANFLAVMLWIKFMDFSYSILITIWIIESFFPLYDKTFWGPARNINPAQRWRNIRCHQFCLKGWKEWRLVWQQWE